MLRKMSGKVALRHKRCRRVRKKVRGSTERPRLCVFRSLRHISAQIIDDTTGKTLVGFGTQSKDARGRGKSKENASFVGERLAALAREKNIEQVIFDRGRYKYHGLIALLADAARKNGLRF
ncbi:MAG: 50S ribosomal protein L18 [Simkaniaceae bacterium]|nr:50S ribosomal protein L18 [Simkaniaceae bacterium]